MTEGEAKVLLGEHLCDKCVNRKCETECDYAKAHDVAIKALDQVAKTGRWIFVDKAHEHAHCSECGYGNVDLFNGRPHNYCPNCGAKMD